MNNVNDPVSIRDRESRVAGKSDEGVVSRVFGDIDALVRSEIALAKAEVNQSVQDAKSGAAAFATGLAVLIPGMLLLVAALALTVDEFTALELWSSTWVVGIIVAAIGAALLFSAKAKLSAENMALSRTGAQLEKDKQLVEEKLS